LTADFFFLVFRALSLAPSPQEIKGQKSSLLLMQKHDDLLRLSIYLVLRFPLLLIGGIVERLYHVPFLTYVPSSLCTRLG
jgi:hypothetical protein